MKIVKKEVTLLKIFLLIRKGARVKLQIFYHQKNGRKQVFLTRAYWRGVCYFCYHYRPLPLMVAANGKVISDNAAVCFQNKSES